MPSVWYPHLRDLCRKTTSENPLIWTFTPQYQNHPQELNTGQILLLNICVFVFFIVTDKYVDIQKSRQILCSVYKNASLEYKNIKIISYKFWFIWILKYIKTIKIIKQIIRADLMNISFGVFWLLIHKNLLNPDFTPRSNCYSWELKQKKTARTEFLMRPLKEFWLRLVLQLSLVENHSVVFV